MARERKTKPAEIGDVPDHWDVVRLSHYTSRITYGFTNPMPTTSEGPFMLTAKDVYDGRIDYENARRTSWDAYRNELTDKSRPRVGDVLLTKDGSIGRVALCDRADVCINQSVALLQPNERIEPRFLKFLLEVPHYQRRMEGDADGTTIKHIYITRVDKMQVAVPPLSEQRAIAAVLGSLDDKIELNRRMNETLEALAQSLFKSWFVDATQSALPKGWRECALGDVIEVKHGFAYQGEFFRDEPCPDILLTPGNFAIGGGFKEDKFKYYEGPTPDDYVLSEGDLLITMTDLSKAGDTLGYGALLPAAPDGHRFHHNQRLGKVLIKDAGVINKPFLYQILRSHEYRAEILGGATGTTVKHTSPGRIKAFKFVLPLESLMQKFGNVAGAWHELAARNRKESRTLATLRDALLPKLLSGELRVPAAAKLPEARA